MATVLHWLAWGFALLWLLALALLAIGTIGLFGQAQDPLSGVFLLPLGLPWSLLAGNLPDRMLPWVLILAPGINLLLLHLAARHFSRLKETI